MTLAADIPTNTEQYSDALAAGASHRNIVGTAGIAGRRERIGHLLWRVLWGGDIGSIPALRGELNEQVAALAKRRRWQAHEQDEAPDLADRVLRWYLVQVCYRCKGRRFQQVPGTPHLSASACPVCRGAGRLGLERAVPHGRLERAKQIALILDLAEQRMSDRVRQAKRDTA